MSEITKSIGVSYERTNPVPLDKSAVAKDSSDAEAILASPTAYNGQVVITTDGEIHPKTSTPNNALCATTPVVFRSNTEDELYTDYYQKILSTGSAGGKGEFMQTRFGKSNIDVCTVGGVLRQRGASNTCYQLYPTIQTQRSWRVSETSAWGQHGGLVYLCKLPKSDVQYRIRCCIVLMDYAGSTNSQEERVDVLSATFDFEFDLSGSGRLILLPKFDEHQYALLPTSEIVGEGPSDPSVEGLALVEIKITEKGEVVYSGVSPDSTKISEINFYVTEICAFSIEYGD